MKPSKLFCFGFGYSAEALVLRLGPGWRIAATARGTEKRAALAARGIEAWIFDGEQALADPASALAETTHLLSSAPPSDHGDPVLACHGSDIARLPGLAWIGYLSTTGVYGDRGGGWAFEDQALTPLSTEGRRRVQAETQWQSFSSQHDVDRKSVV